MFYLNGSDHLLRLQRKHTKTLGVFEKAKAKLMALAQEIQGAQDAAFTRIREIEAERARLAATMQDEQQLIADLDLQRCRTERTAEKIENLIA